MSDNQKTQKKTSASNKQTEAESSQPIRARAPRETDAQKIARICALKLS